MNVPPRSLIREILGASAARRNFEVDSALVDSTILWWKKPKEEGFRKIEMVLRTKIAVEGLLMVMVPRSIRQKSKARLCSRREKRREEKILHRDQLHVLSLAGANSPSVNSWCGDSTLPKSQWSQKCLVGSGLLAGVCIAHAGLLAGACIAGLLTGSCIASP